MSAEISQVVDFSTKDNETDTEPMNELHFNRAVKKTRIKGKMRDACFQCLVLGRQQGEIAEELGLSQSNMSTNMATIRNTWKEIADENKMETFEVSFKHPAAAAIKAWEKDHHELVFNQKPEKKK